MLDEYLVVGEIARPQGVRGELKIKPLTDDPERFYDLKRVFLQGEARALHCTRVHAGFAYARLEGVYSREAAEALRGELLKIHRDDAVPLADDTDFICDLIGCRATDTEGVDHGLLTDVLQPGGVDVYVFEGKKGQLMVPALRRAVPEVNVREKRILLDADALREMAVYQ
ncbi:MAG: ribosome maturation factor RimM [Oscillospiraceae bacterium]|jgi:16S rRNA processing protein RimM|nr:ribosome maturation factor RimM [Oscillospiraceae bacterium]